MFEVPGRPCAQDAGLEGGRVEDGEEDAELRRLVGAFERRVGGEQVVERRSGWDSVKA